MKNNDNKLKPVKAEQPYSYIQRGRDDLDADPNNLDIWKRFSGHGKVTKENLDDALEVRNTAAFDNFPLVGSMNAPEGKSKDYFLKAKDKILGEQNAYNIGEFLDNFHGMDYFRKGVPKVEEGLKGTGYDMGPSAKIVDKLKEAADKGDTKEVENIIEEHPEESQEVLPEDTPIQEEAKQITEDTNKANDEVNNEVVEDFVEDSQAESELFPVGYNTEQVTDPNVGSIPEDLPENNRPLDSFVLNNYDDDKDRGELTPPIVSNNDNKAEVTTENDTDIVGNTPELDNTSLENEAQQIESDTDNLDVDNVEDFEAYAQKAQDEFNKVQAEQKAKAKALKKEYGGSTGRGTNGMRLPSTGMLGGKHWYEVDSEKLYEYADTLIDDGEGLLAMASEMARNLSDNDSWSSYTRGSVGAVATHGNGLIKRGKRLKAVRKYLQEHGINPAELKPSTRKAILSMPLPGEKYNRKGKQEDYEYNLNFILNNPSEAPAVIEKTVIEPIEHEMGKQLPEEIKSKMIREPQFAEELIDWDKVKVYRPGEDPYIKVSDENDWKDNPDYEPGFIGIEDEKDEDFLGPDEYIDENGNIQVDPNWKPENADEDFVGPDEQLAVINDGLPAEIPYEPVYDTSDYNFDWEAVVETLPPDVQQELNELPEEDKEEISNLLHWKTKKLGDIKTGGSVASSDAIDMGSSRGGIGGSSRNPVGNSMLGMSLAATNANVGKGMHESTKMDSNASIASKAPVPPTVNETTGAHVGGSNNNIPRSNGSIGSGSGLLFSKVGMLKSVKTAPDIPMLGHTSSVDELNAPTVEDTIDDMKDGLVKTLDAKLNANPEMAERLGFDHKYKHWAYKGISLDEMSFSMLSELTNKLDNVL